MYIDVYSCIDIYIIFQRVPRPAGAAGRRARAALRRRARRRRRSSRSAAAQPPRVSGSERSGCGLELCASAITRTCPPTYTYTHTHSERGGGYGGAPGGGGGEGGGGDGGRETRPPPHIKATHSE